MNETMNERVPVIVVSRYSVSGRIASGPHIFLQSVHFTTHNSYKAFCVIHNQPVVRTNLKIGVR